jgi:hypothetical protein
MMMVMMMMVMRPDLPSIGDGRGDPPVALVLTCPPLPHSW